VVRKALLSDTKRLAERRFSRGVELWRGRAGTRTGDGGRKLGVMVLVVLVVHPVPVPIDGVRPVEVGRGG
jgi:hypothetical protein